MGVCRPQSSIIKNVFRKHKTILFTYCFRIWEIDYYYFFFLSVIIKDTRKVVKNISPEMSYQQVNLQMSNNSVKVLKIET